MKTHHMQLDKILNMHKWQILQDSLAISTNLAIITVDYKGVPITRHSERRPFCKMVRESPHLEEFCRKCDSRGGLEAVRLNKPYIYLCHCNIVDIAIPIIVNDKYIGAIMAGQVTLSDSRYDLEKILISPRQDLLQTPAFRRAYDMLPVVSYREVEIVSQMLYDLCQYIVSEALNRNLMMEVSERLRPIDHAGSDLFFEGYGVDAIHSVRKELGNAVASAYVESSSKKLTCTNPVLQPAFDYIFNNRRENVPQKKAASLCHISASHFSRLFAKETGENFSRFISRQKVEWAKHLLEHTDLSITQISEDLGFGEPGYFIKTFKKYEAVTPTTYRKYFRESRGSK
ncbi:MAG: PocR ligand-binding domain-containing protein [Oscillospiraceae bacterium]|nr:PocR ligand-binding domain-containing protein [Oscillospiraceae bacterium]